MTGRITSRPGMVVADQVRQTHRHRQRCTVIQLVKEFSDRTLNHSLNHSPALDVHYQSTHLLRQHSSSACWNTFTRATTDAIAIAIAIGTCTGDSSVTIMVVFAVVVIVVVHVIIDRGMLDYLSFSVNPPTPNLVTTTR